MKTKRQNRVFLNSQPNKDSDFCGTMKVSAANLQEGDLAWNQVFRSGNWENSYKSFKVKKSELQEFVKNFDANVLNMKEKEIQVNYSHESWNKAAGWITALRVNGRHLEAQIRWTPQAQQAITDEEFKYFSAEISWAYKDEESGEIHKNVLTGAALTNIPFVRGMKSASLSEKFKEDPEQDKKLLFLNTSTMKTFKKSLAHLSSLEKVSLAEVNLLKVQFAELSEEDQEAAKPEVEKIEEKAKETETKEAEAAATAETEAAATLADLNAKVKLAGKNDSELQKEVVELSGKLEKTTAELSVATAASRKLEIKTELDALEKGGHMIPAQREKMEKLSETLSVEDFSSITATMKLTKQVELNKEVGDGGAAPAGAGEGATRQQALQDQFEKEARAEFSTDAEVAASISEKMSAAIKADPTLLK